MAKRRPGKFSSRFHACWCHFQTFHGARCCDSPRFKWLSVSGTHQLTFCVSKWSSKMNLSRVFSLLYTERRKAMHNACCLCNIRVTIKFANFHTFVMEVLVSTNSSRKSNVLICEVKLQWFFAFKYVNLTSVDVEVALVDWKISENYCSMSYYAIVFRVHYNITTTHYSKP